MPSIQAQQAVLFAGRIAPGNGKLDLEGAEQRLVRSGWHFRGRTAKDACVLCLAATGWDIPPDDSTRKDWYNALKAQAQKFPMTELASLYTEAYRRLNGARNRDPDFIFPPRPGSLTKTMEAIWDERKHRSSDFTVEDGKRYKVIK